MWARKHSLARDRTIDLKKIREFENLNASILTTFADERVPFRRSRLSQLATQFDDRTVRRHADSRIDIYIEAGVYRRFQCVWFHEETCTIITTSTDAHLRFAGVGAGAARGFGEWRCV